jgi:hypothetical protein
MAISSELIEKNYSLFIFKLQKLGINTTQLELKLGDKLKYATFNITNGGVGTLLHTIMRTLTPNALKIAELNAPEGFTINNETLIKVCLLSHISKAEMFRPKENNPSQYEYAPYPYPMKMGLRSIALCEECDIKLTAEEIEAMTILDRETEDQAKFFASPLAQIVKIANELTFLHLKFIK